MPLKSLLPPKVEAEKKRPCGAQPVEEWAEPTEGLGAGAGCVRK